MFNKIGDEFAVARRLAELHKGCWYTLVIEVGRKLVPPCDDFPKGAEIVMTSEVPFTYGLNYDKYKTKVLADEIRNATTPEQVKACRAKFNSFKKSWETTTSGHIQDLVPANIIAILSAKEKSVEDGVTTLDIIKKKRTHIDVITEGLNEEDAKAIKKKYFEEMYPPQLCGLKVVAAREEVKKTGVIKHPRKVFLPAYDARRIDIRTGSWSKPRDHFYAIIGDEVEEIIGMDKEWYNAAREEIRASNGLSAISGGADIVHDYNINKIIAIKGGKK